MTIGDFETVELLDAAGRVFQIARIPRIERRFSSPMHSCASLPVQLGPWNGELEALRDGRMPFARLSDPAGDPLHGPFIRAAVIEALTEGYAAALHTQPDGSASADLARTDAICDTVDLEDLKHDVRVWLAGAGALDEQAEEQIADAICVLSESSYADYLLRATDLPAATLHGAIEKAIVTGQDPATAIAFYLAQCTGEAFYWHPATDQPPAPRRSAMSADHDRVLACAAEALEAGSWLTAAGNAEVVEIVRRLLTGQSLAGAAPDMVTMARFYLDAAITRVEHDKGDAGWGGS